SERRPAGPKGRAKGETSASLKLTSACSFNARADGGQTSAPVRRRVVLWLGQARGRISSSASIPHDAHHEKDKYKEFADEDSCSSGTVDMQAMEARQRRVLMAVLAINIATFVMMLPVAIYRILVAAVGQPGQPGRCAHLPSKY